MKTPAVVEPTRQQSDNGWRRLHEGLPLSAPAKISGHGMPRRRLSLPWAGFCLYRAHDAGCAIEKFTTHRADPSWT